MVGGRVIYADQLKADCSTPSFTFIRSESTAGRLISRATRSQAAQAAHGIPEDFQRQPTSREAAPVHGGYQQKGERAKESDMEEW